MAAGMLVKRDSSHEDTSFNVPVLPLRHAATASPVVAPLPPCLRLQALLTCLVPPPATGQTGNSGPGGSRSC